MRLHERLVKEVAFIVILSRITAVLFPPAMSFILERPILIAVRDFRIFTANKVGVSASIMRHMHVGSFALHLAARGPRRIELLWGVL